MAFAFNRIQNPILQDRVHGLLGIKGFTAAPTLASEVQPVVIVGNVSDTPETRQQRWVMGHVRTTAIAGQLIMVGGLFNTLGSGVLIKLRRARICGATVVAAANQFGCAFDDLNPQQGGTSRETHRQSPEITIARLVTYTVAGVIAGVFQRRNELGTGGNADVLFEFEDLVLQPGQGISFMNLTIVGMAAGTILDFNFEWREDDAR